MQMAVEQVAIRQDLLFDGKEFWRTRSDDGHRDNLDWAQGIAWQILGIVRSLSAAQHQTDISELIDGRAF